MRKEFFLKNKKGQKISVVLYNHSGCLEKRETIISCHGFTNDKEEMFYPFFFPRLVRQGYQVLAFDMNGHGKSEGRFFDFTTSQAANDLLTVYNYAVSKGVKRIGIMGHSLGGAVCLLAAHKINIQSIILLSPVSQPFLLHLKKQDWRFMDRFGFYPRPSFRTGKYYQVGRNFFKDFERLPLIEAGRHIKVPFLLIHAGRDRAVPVEDSRKLFNNLDFDVKSFKVIAGSDHNFQAPKYYQPVIDAASKWLKLYLKKGIDEVASVMLKRPDGKFILVKRSPEVGFFPNFWGGLGGFIHKGETLEETALREIKEETGLASASLKLIKKIKPYVWRDHYNDRLWRVHGLFYETTSSHLKTDWESAAYHWINFKELKKFKLVPNQVGVINKLNSI